MGAFSLIVVINLLNRSKMESLVAVPFVFLECPHLKLKKPSWLCMPSPMFMFAVVMIAYFLFTVGVIYDVIVEPPSIGQTTDPHTGHTKPVAFMPYRINGQYIMEGLAASFLFTMGGFGFIVLDKSNGTNLNKLSRTLLIFTGCALVLISFFLSRVFIGMKLPGYMT